MVAASWYADVLDSLYAAIEGQDPSPYRGLDHDAWTRARRLPTSDDVGHLLTYIWLDGIPAGGVLDGGWAIDRTGRLAFVHRYNPDDDSTSLCRLLAAEEHVISTLLGWQGPHGGRVLDIASTEVVQIDEQWIGSTVTFLLRTTRG